VYFDVKNILYESGDFLNGGGGSLDLGRAGESDQDFNVDTRH
jgi:hypothetical protein